MFSHLVAKRGEQRSILSSHFFEVEKSSTRQSKLNVAKIFLHPKNRLIYRLKLYLIYQKNMLKLEGIICHLVFFFLLKFVLKI